MVIVGLTGGLATGKSTAAKMFRDLGARVIDADKEVHRLLSPKGACFKRVVRTFGTAVVERGRINRKKLGQLIFAKPALRKDLEEIIHPQVRLVIKEKIQKYRRGKRTKVLILEIPLLFESHWHRQVDTTIVVSAPQKQQMERATDHLKISQEEARQRIRAQMPLQQKIDLADYVLRNNSTKGNLRKQVQKTYQHILQLDTSA